MSRPAVVIVGLGPAGPEFTTEGARQAIEAAEIAFVRTARHPAVGAFPTLVPLDECYEEASTFDDAYRAIVERVVLAAQSGADGVVYAVPGSPTVAEATVAMLRSDDRVETTVLAALSFLDLAWERLAIDPVDVGLRLLDAAAFPTTGAFDHGPLLLVQCWFRAVLSTVKLALEDPPQTPAVLLHHLGLPDEVVVALPWEEIDRAVEADHLTSLYIPVLASPVGAELARLDEVVRVLRERCPWDREQTHESLARHLLEETYETLEAIDELRGGGEAAAEHLEEELGDVLCQVYFHAVLAAEAGFFDLAGVARGAHEKLVRRHPHVFADVVATTSEAVVANWETGKQAEKGRSSVMEGIPAALPALALAAKVERKAAGLDLGWREQAPGEEREQDHGEDRAARREAPLLDAPTANMPGVDVSGMLRDPGFARAALARLRDGDDAPFGELLLALARAGTSLGAEPEEALRRAIGRFRDRFASLEALRVPPPGPGGPDPGTRSGP